MKIKKIIVFLTTLLVCLSIAGVAFAEEYTINGAYFSKGKSHNVTGQLGPTVYVWTKANELINTPTINIKCEAKVGLFYGGGASADKQISSTGTIYVATFTKASKDDTRVTWKQTNDNASMTAYLNAHSN